MDVSFEPAGLAQEGDRPSGCPQLSRFRDSLPSRHWRPTRHLASGFLASELRRTCRAEQRTARRSGPGREVSPDGEPTHDLIGPRATSGRRAREVRPERAPPLAVFTELTAVAPVLSAVAWAAGRAWNGPGPHTLVLH